MIFDWLFTKHTKKPTMDARVLKLEGDLKSTRFELEQIRADLNRQIEEVRQGLEDALKD